MKNITKLVPMRFACVLMMAVGILLGVPALGANNSATNTTAKAVTKSKPAPGENAMKSMTQPATEKTNHALAPAEDLSGTISMIDATNKEITVIGSNGVPYDFELTKKTQVQLTNKTIELNELASESNKQATIHFIPRSDGNLAKSIRISGS
jgi:hypothetical protein